MRQHHIPLQVRTSPGVYDSSGPGAALLAFFAGMSEPGREYIWEKSLEVQFGTTTALNGRSPKG
ncbi:hypothetical protein HEP86_02290 [Streptomyces sp. RPA4-5]|nr:hypothetical protein HEP86_02290 [Streptomyces sp. RPA4-5]